jgi:hypothetical protein
MRPANLLVAASIIFGVTAAVVAQRPDAFHESRDHAAIAYTKTPATDPVAQLNRKLADGSVKLTHQSASGYLRSLLDALHVPIESQMLVFSETSKQASQINFLNPRAVFFNDTVHVGWVRGADTLEIAARDPRQGVIFYTLSQTPNTPVRVKREEECLLCHLTWDTLGVPGLMALSTYPLPDDKNAYATGFTTDHRSPFSERWGGWFVTGRHGNSRHMGNLPVMPADTKKSKIASPIRDLASVNGLFDLTGYPTPYSDIVALLVFDHQAHMTNLLTRLGWEARVAAVQPKASGRVRDAARDVVDYMLFVDEAPFPAKVQGTAGFAEKFTALGPRDSKGRSLRDFELDRRLFRYPCSYLIYSETFDALPPNARDAVYSQLFSVLTGKDTRPELKRLTAADRTAILEILRDTKKNLPAYFRPAAS